MGFSILPAIVSEALISQIISELEHPIEQGVSIRKQGQNTYAMRNLLCVPCVQDFSKSATVRSVVEPILGRMAIAVRGLLFDKTPNANWNVAWHQDLCIAVRQRAEVPGFGPWSLKAGIQHVQAPVSVLEEMLTLRLHLDDCSEENGPLQVLPASHRSGKLTTRQIAEWRSHVQPAVCCVPRGGVLVMHPLLLHSSSAARTPGHRRVIHLEFAAGDLPAGLEWFSNESFTEARA